MWQIKSEALVLQQNGQAICQPFDWQCQAGETWGVLGPNGIGKSTLLQTLAGLNPCLKGHCQISNKVMLGAKMGILLQNIHYRFAETVRENLDNAFSIFSHMSDEEIKQKHQYVEDVLTIWQLSSLADKSIQCLSGGEQQRLALARLYLQKPYIWLYDEPTNHLDPQYRRLLAAHIKARRQQNHLQIIAAHDLNWISSCCTHFLFMYENGEIKYGAKALMLTEKHLQRLFDCPLRVVTYQGQDVIVGC